MKKEGRLSRTHMTTVRAPEYNPSRPNNYINRELESEYPPPQVGRTGKAHPRPNKHSKSKGRCFGCQVQIQIQRSSSKWEENSSRGYYKKKSGGVLDRANQKLVHNGPGLKFGGGFSATDALDRLATQEYYDGQDCDAYDSDNASDANPSSGSHTPRGVNEEEDEEDGMSFCHVGFVVEDEIEDWCLVDEL